MFLYEERFRRQLSHVCKISCCMIKFYANIIFLVIPILKIILFTHTVWDLQGRMGFSRGAAREGCSGCGAQVHHCGGCSSLQGRLQGVQTSAARAQTQQSRFPGSIAQQWKCTGLVVPQHVESPWTTIELLSPPLAGGILSPMNQHGSPEFLNVYIKLAINGI